MQQGYYSPPQYGPQYSGCLKLFLYAVSFFIPLVGLILGLVYISRPDFESKRLGQACLILGIVSFVLSCCVGLFFGLAPLLSIPFLEDVGYY
jgi:hypothetical protein